MVDKSKWLPYLILPMALVKAKDGAVTIFVLSETETEEAKREEEAKAYLTEHGLEGKVRRMINPTPRKMESAVRFLGPVALFCRDDLYGDDLCELVNRIENPVLLVR